jgi:putative acetyltransferase
MIVRREIPSDHEALAALFKSVSSPELIETLRASDAWLPALSFVALGAEGEVIGHVAGTRGQLGADPVLALLPPSVDPDQRGQGVGQALMHAILGAAEALGEPLVGLVAVPPEYYARFGFAAAEEYAIIAPVDDWRPYFQVRPLSAYRDSMRGSFTFPEPFLSG